MSMKVYLGMKMDAIKSRFTGTAEEKKTRIDTALPLGLRVGSRVKISEVPFMLAGEGIYVAYPGEESLVGAYSESDMAGLKSFRFYLKDRNDEAQESILLALMDESGSDVAEIYLFREQAEIPLYYNSLDEVPPDGDEVNAVNFWIGEQAGIIGMPLFNTPDDIVYERLWQNELDAHIPPLSMNERIHLDPYGDTIMQVEHLGTMLYARSVEGLSDAVDEYIMPTVEKDDDGFRVRIWVGLPLALSDIELPDTI
jgi:hypothetical protein